jgi:hypothetical protein
MNIRVWIWINQLRYNEQYLERYENVLSVNVREKGEYCCSSTPMPMDRKSDWVCICESSCGCVPRSEWVSEHVCEWERVCVGHAKKESQPQPWRCCCSHLATVPTPFHIKPTVLTHSDWNTHSADIQEHTPTVQTFRNTHTQCRQSGTHTHTVQTCSNTQRNPQWDLYCEVIRRVCQSYSHVIITTVTLQHEAGVVVTTVILQAWSCHHYSNNTTWGWGCHH